MKLWHKNFVAYFWTTLYSGYTNRSDQTGLSGCSGRKNTSVGLYVKRYGTVQFTTNEPLDLYSNSACIAVRHGGFGES